MERHLWSCRNALPRHYRADTAERDRPHRRRRLRATERAAGRKALRRSCSRASMPAWPSVPATGRRASPNGGRCCGPSSVGAGGDPHRAQAWAACTCSAQHEKDRHVIRVRRCRQRVAAALVLLAGGGYLAFTANVPAPGSSATLNLSTEQLEQVLAERRKADALVVEKRRLEEEARQKAETDAEAKRQADAQLEQARQALQKAEQELATAEDGHRGAPAACCGTGRPGGGNAASRGGSGSTAQGRSGGRRPARGRGRGSEEGGGRGRGQAAGRSGARGGGGPAQAGGSRGAAPRPRRR